MYSFSRLIGCAAFCLLFGSSPPLCHAGWTNPGALVEISGTASSMKAAVPDGAGGVIVAWMGGDNQFNTVRVQRVTADGTLLWGEDGVLLTERGTPDYGEGVAIAEDGRGGAVVSWVERSPSGELQVYAQKLGGDGVRLWSAQGVQVCPESRSQRSPLVVTEPAGGAIVLWIDYRENIDQKLFAQHLSAAGAPLWARGGVRVAESAFGAVQDPAVACSDGVGGAYVAWEDALKIRVQHLNGSGERLWTETGQLLSPTGGFSTKPSISGDGQGGVLVAYDHSAYPFDGHTLYAHRLAPDGRGIWGPGGATVCTTWSYHADNQIVPDLAGGAIIAWLDFRTEYARQETYVQRVSDTGVALWNSDGIQLAPSAVSAPFNGAVSDGLGGALITYSDGGVVRVTRDGQFPWGRAGVSISAPGDSGIPVSNGRGGCLVVRGGSNLTAAHINTLGYLAAQGPATGFRSRQGIRTTLPGPADFMISYNYTTSALDLLTYGPGGYEMVSWGFVSHPDNWIGLYSYDANQGRFTAADYRLRQSF